jgi:excisionase family DNA binding protein
MKSRPIQFGVREDIAPSRQHDSRVTKSLSSCTNCPKSQFLSSHPSLTSEEHQATTSDRPQYAASGNAATDAEEVRIHDIPLTVKEAAKFLGVSPQTVYLWVERKQIPHLRVMGRNIRFLKPDLDSFRASFKQEMENE